jgi:spermidine/putrescine transport system ATP-binding protein
MRGIGRAEAKKTVDEMLGLVKLTGLGGRRPNQLSGGQQQRVALARALANHPKVLLLDEPLSALDLKLRQEMRSELKKLQTKTGITFIFVTHDQEEALTMSDRIAVMSHGKILQIGSPAQIYEHPTVRFVADFIGETNFLPAHVTALIGDKATVRLPGGIEFAATAVPGIGNGMDVTVAVRPERLSLTVPGAGAINGRVENIVYFGTDTSYQVALQDGVAVTVRAQNRDGARPRFAVGDPVGLDLTADALQVLRD